MGLTAVDIQFFLPLGLHLFDSASHFNASDSFRLPTMVGVLTLALGEMDGDHVAVHVSRVSLIPLKEMEFELKYEFTVGIMKQTTK